MTQSQRRLLLVVGSLLTLLGALLVGSVLFGGELLAIAEIGAFICMLGAGPLFVLAGLRDDVTVGRRRYHWWQCSALGLILLGGSFVLGASEQQSIFLQGLSVLTGCSLGILGIQQLRNGEPDLESEAEFSTRAIAFLIVGMMAMVLLIAVVLVLSG